MAASNKRIKNNKAPQGNKILTGGSPDKYYNSHPSWRFSTCDREAWSLFSTKPKDIFWDEILPRLKNLETQTWSDILVNAKKQNHLINIPSLSKTAVDRLNELMLELDSIISLRLTGTHRIYGFMDGSTFNILWVDLNHGDNKDCVCRSHKKHT